MPLSYVEGEHCITFNAEMKTCRAGITHYPVQSIYMWFNQVDVVSELVWFLVNLTNTEDREKHNRHMM